MAETALQTEARLAIGKAFHAVLLVVGRASGDVLTEQGEHRDDQHEGDHRNAQAPAWREGLEGEPQSPDVQAPPWDGGLVGLVVIFFEVVGACLHGNSKVMTGTGLFHLPIF